MNGADYGPRGHRRRATHDNLLRLTLHWDCNAHSFLAGGGHVNEGGMIAGDFAGGDEGDEIPDDAVG